MIQKNFLSTALQMTFGGAPYPPLLGLYIRHHFGPRECTNPRHNMGLEVVREKFLICIWKTYFPKVGHAFLSFPLFWLRKRKLTSRILWSDVFRVSVLDLENICSYDGRRCRHTLVIIIYGVSGYVVTLVEKAFLFIFSSTTYVLQWYPTPPMIGCTDCLGC